ncbi:MULTISPECIES: GntR family transcriptional regulator [Bacillus]|jgi:DNA-binding transcriptional regulator YhcF (GntR family)|uniref:GntR family transcriptional regulator n=1 Tax=Bacillus pseudomycoides TaxID=64104 RepID=A0AAJ3V7Z5_9BACI|nr:GntR family transcriptional regulator [Bacillus pseudomycoides]EEM05219.1 Regulatory protein GntR, HTH [Bacillus pseudomycoides]KFN14229.1 bacterial regulatory s, gntR family protein [Bacillus pseudomycoides]MCR8858100.1 GntR family transcriptional regulator [Bacillus pseudomycoides]MDR4189569.1 GntR family transcriptional regulator [Bacillus pseudomycoides]MDR4327387.1 GntR family transcriptional regulator [Bacillus pseudomycoides]
MKTGLEQNKLIYVQIAEAIESDILKGILLEEEKVPSTNEFAKMLQINPATAAKGVNLLVDEGILYKKRGIGMFVAKGAKEVVLKKRQSAFMNEFLPKVWEEAKVLEISKEELMNMIQKITKEGE